MLRKNATSDLFPRKEHPMKTRKTLLAFAFAAAAGTSGSAVAGPFPVRPITLVVGFQAGGPADTTARILAERMRQSLGQPVIIENMPGGSGSIAGGRVA